MIDRRFRISGLESRTHLPGQDPLNNTMAVIQENTIGTDKRPNVPDLVSLPRISSTLIEIS